MKSNFKLLIPMGIVISTLAWWGCEPRTVPVGAYAAPGSIFNQSLVVNFDELPITITTSIPPVTVVYFQPPSSPITDTNGFPLTQGYPINPYLAEPGVPGNVLQFPGSVQVVNNFPNNEAATLTFSGPGANNSRFAARIFGTLNDPGTGIYPAVDFQVPMENGNQYNMGFFTGVKFYFKTSLADSAVKRVFQIPTIQTQALPSGACNNSTNKCYDHFTATLTSTGGAWQSYSIKFTDLTRQGFGFPLNGPPNLTGVNLQQVLWLQWEESNNNVQTPNGGITIDFWVDEVEFF